MFALILCLESDLTAHLELLGKLPVAERSQYDQLDLPVARRYGRTHHAVTRHPSPAAHRPPTPTHAAAAAAVETAPAARRGVTRHPLPIAHQPQHPRRRRGGVTTPPTTTPTTPSPVARCPPRITASSNSSTISGGSNGSSDNNNDDGLGGIAPPSL